jgi:hypothetical protein
MLAARSVHFELVWWMVLLALAGMLAALALTVPAY